MFSSILRCWLCISFHLMGLKTDSSNLVQESVGHTLSCYGFTKSIGRNVRWLRSGTTSEIISECNNSPHCEDNFLRKYRATYESSNTFYNSSLIIYNVTVAERGAIFECEVHDYATLKDTKVGTWILNKTYRPPETMNCTAKLTADIEMIKVSCEIQMFYPDIRCTMRRIVNGNEEDNEIQMQSQITGQSTITLYKNGSCYSDLYITEPGTYSFSVHAYPHVDKHFIYTASLSGSAEYFVSNASTVTILLDNIYCPGNIRLECIALWFLKGSPRFSWYHGGFPITHGSVNTTEHNKGTFFMYKSILMLPSTILRQGEYVNCTFNLSNSTNRYFDMKKINVSSPPSSPPIFKVNNSQAVGGRISIHNSTNISALCEVQGGKPVVISVTVECFRPNGHNTRYQINATSLIFQIQVNQTLNEIRCTCSAKHISKCYNLTASLVVVYTSNESTDSGESQLSDTIIIILAVLFFMAFIFIVAIIVFIKKNWNTLYSQHNYREALQFESIRNTNVNQRQIEAHEHEVMYANESIKEIAAPKTHRRPLRNDESVSINLHTQNVPISRKPKKHRDSSSVKMCRRSERRQCFYENVSAEYTEVKTNPRRGHVSTDRDRTSTYVNTDHNFHKCISCSTPQAKISSRDQHNIQTFPGEISLGMMSKTELLRNERLKKYFHEQSVTAATDVIEYISPSSSITSEYISPSNSVTSISSS